LERASVRGRSEANFKFCETKPNYWLKPQHGTGEDITIADFARLVAEVVGYRGQLAFDTSRPDGAPQKLLDVSKLTQLGWHAKTPLREGIAVAYADFLAGGGRTSSSMR
jgi:nucleoside-diphosphate-sugar epimerase